MHNNSKLHYFYGCDGTKSFDLGFVSIAVPSLKLYCLYCLLGNFES